MILLWLFGAGGASKWDGTLRDFGCQFLEQDGLSCQLVAFGSGLTINWQWMPRSSLGWVVEAPDQVRGGCRCKSTFGVWWFIF